MIGALVVFFALVWVLTADMRLKKKAERIQRDKRFETVTFIQIDGRTTRGFGIMSIVSLVGFGASCEIADHVEPAAGVLVMVFAGMLIICLPSWLIGRSYLWRLKKMGYEIPWRSKDYDYVLENLPVKRKDWDTAKYNKRSKLFALIYVGIWICMLAVNTYIYYKWRFINGIELVFIFLAVDLYWGVRALQFRKQMSNEKYKEDIEIDKNRKTRIGLEHAVCEMLVMLVIICVGKNMFTNYVDYVYRSQLDTDKGWMKEIHGMMELIYEGLEAPQAQDYPLFTPEEVAQDWSGTRQQLMEGVNIMEWEIPQDIYQRRLAEHLGISDFSQIKKYFRSVKGEVEVFAKIENGVLTLSLSDEYRNGESIIVVESAKILPEKIDETKEGTKESAEGR